MKITVEVTSEELEDMAFDSLDEFEGAIRHQLAEGVVGDDGDTGSDWMCDYHLEIVKVG